MRYDIPWNLLEKYFAKETSSEENMLVNEWRASAPENEMIFEQLKSYFEITGTLPIEFIPDTQAALNKVSEIISGKPKQKIFRIPTMLYKAAVILLLITCGWWVLHVYIKNQATPLVTVFTIDSVRSLTLSDGSHIWLNTKSEIRYPEKFNSTREIYLKGEAYFEIAHDALHPFIIRSGKTITRVIGTKFNIRSFLAENLTYVSVTEGKVIFGISSGQQVALTRGQKATFDNSLGKVSKTDIDNPNFLAWKTMEFLFDNQSLESVLGSLSEVYHFNYRFENNNLKQRRISAKFNHRPLNEIIETLAASADVTISLQNGVYHLK